MQDFARQAKEALSVYLKRGEAALEALKAGNYDEATDLLRKRNAAFHNFRAQDALASKTGRDLGEDAEVRAIWQSLRKLESELNQELQVAKEKTGTLHQKIRDARQKIIRYHSGNPDQPRFEKTA
jgi:hypothetical protein